MHELDIQLELYLSRCFNISLVSGELHQKIYTQAKRQAGVQKNSFGRFLGSLNINYSYNVLNIIRELRVIKQDFKPFGQHFHLKKVQYIRYIDHFILAIVGDKRCAYDVLVFIHIILDSLGIALSGEKCGVKSSVKGVVFLGYHIYNQCSFDLK